MDASTQDSADAAVTPMMAQYLEIKATAGDALLFYRMGDFYELFFDDAVTASAALEIALTKRGRHRGDDIPMCGVPWHSHESYLARLIKKGFKVAICEQTEDPAEAKKRGGKAVVRRAIVRVVTPGTLTEDTLLDASRNNYLGALAILSRGEEAALAWTDMSTGELFVCRTSADEFQLHAAALSLSELVVADHEELSEAWNGALADFGRYAALARQPAAIFDSRSGERRLRETFGVASLDGFGAFTRADISALGGVLAYIELTQAGKRPALLAPRRAEASAAMLVDQATRASLELLEAQAGGRDRSLFAAVDRTATAPGARLLAARLSSPLTDPKAINRRLDAVAVFAADGALCEKLHATLRAMPDMARSLSRLSLTRGGPRDLAAIRDGLLKAREIAGLLRTGEQLSPRPEEISEALDALEAREAGGFSGLTTLLKEALAPEIPLLARDGGFIAKDFDPGLDNLRLLRDESRRVIAGLEAKYRGDAGLRQLKIRHNNVLGYFIELPPSVGDRLMEEPFSATFIHRQTLASAVRFTTTELADLDAKIARARDGALARELEIFDQLAAAVLERSREIAAAAAAAASLDVALGFATLAREDGYVRPLIDASLAFDVRGGRHPVVEQALRRNGGERFHPNDCILAQNGEAHLWLMTGPNMAGKSTFLRQNALIVILAQAGGFVPAVSAHIGAADRVFSRVGAADDLARGRSTFMVEMVETAAILNQASERSIVVLDEIGRGTSTFDGLSIAWAAVEHLHDVNRCRGLFATHYHELTALSGTLPRLRNASMRVREWKGDVVFLHEVAMGPADRSYGVAVARLAGLPKPVIARAESVLAMLESQRAKSAPITDLPLFAALPVAEISQKSKEPAERAIRAALTEINPDALTPRDALGALYRLKSLADEV